MHPPQKICGPLNLRDIFQPKIFYQPAMSIHTVPVTLETGEYIILEVPDPIIPPRIVERGPFWWSIHVGDGHNVCRVCASLDEATRFVTENIASGDALHFIVDLKTLHSDDNDPRVANGEITGLRWRCPTRAMTREEVLSHPTIKSYPSFKRSWLASPPQVPQYPEGIHFVHSPVSVISISRGSREIGYIQRAGLPQRQDQRHRSPRRSIPP